MKVITTNVFTTLALLASLAQSSAAATPLTVEHRPRTTSKAIHFPDGTTTTLHGNALVTTGPGGKTTITPRTELPGGGATSYDPMNFGKCSNVLEAIVRANKPRSRDSLARQWFWLSYC